ncbi:MAG: nucleoside hydrolase [Acidobacteria bacterium]|nr:nucleoside hydrolase [Acidobacteriota bacterium]
MDDAIAILLAFASPEIEVVAITAVAGNVGLDKTALNARRLADLVDRPVVVAAGCAEPLSDPVTEDSVVHGRDGLGDLEWDEPRTILDPRHATEVIYDAAVEGPLTIVAIGPLTNLAVALERHPDLESMVERVVIMGGASFEGNVTPAAEFNIWVDPEAARRVFAASWPIDLMPLDLTHQAYLVDEDLEEMRSWGTVIGERCSGMLEPYAAFHDEWYGNRDVIMHDAMCVYELVSPGAITLQGVRLAVEVAGEHARGATFIDRRRALADSVQRVGVHVDNAQFRRFLLDRLHSLTPRS